MTSSTDEKTITILTMSDTHDFHQYIQIQSLPHADIFIHAGDFTQYSIKQEHDRFIQFLKKLPYKHKIVVAGNHDFVLDKQSYEKSLKKSKHKLCPLNSDQEIKRLKQVCTYLEHGEIQVEGLKIFGSPFSLKFFQWGFMYSEQQAKNLMSCIPQNTDVLVTHGPPYGILDNIYNGQNVGCKQLLKVIEKVKPKVHIFGHIHESYGHKKVKQTNFYNASFVNENYVPYNKPHLIEIKIDLKTGHKQVVQTKKQTFFSKITKKVGNLF